MAFDLASISNEAVARAPRIVLLGVEKIGKTSFACGDRVADGKIVEYGLNRPVIVSVRGEQGADSIPVPKFPVAQTFDDVMEALGTLYTQEHPFSTVVMDSVSTLYRRVKEKVQLDNPDLKADKEYDRYNRGPNIAVGYFEKLLSGFTALREKKNMASILIGHVKTKTVNSPDQDPFDAWVWDIPDIISNLIFRWADAIWLAKTPDAVSKVDGEKFGQQHRRSVDVDAGRRYLYTQKRSKHPGGGRGIYGHLPYQIDLSWAAVQEELAKLAAGKDLNNAKQQEK
jgi:hypothetical protein